MHDRSYQEEREDDTANEEPFPRVKRNEKAAICSFAFSKNLIRPLLGRQHGNGGEDIGDVDQE